MGFWGLVYVVRNLFSAAFRRPPKADSAPPDPAGHHAMMLAAARAGDVRAQYQLAVCYSEGKGVEQDYGEAAHWFREAARQGDVMPTTASEYVTPTARVSRMNRKGR
jgi:TPR repeat protein